MIKINSENLFSIALAAEIFFKHQDEKFKAYNEEAMIAAKKLKEELKNAEWAYDTELMIDELPF